VWRTASTPLPAAPLPERDSLEPRDFELADRDFAGFCLDDDFALVELDLLDDLVLFGAARFFGCVFVSAIVPLLWGGVPIGSRTQSNAGKSAQTDACRALHHLESAAPAAPAEDTASQSTTTVIVATAVARIRRSRL
jgi:hypothetical protein